jgi:hypothetical protein
MINERFLRRLEDAFPHFYDRSNADAMEDAQRILKETGGDVEKALLRARLESAARLWWPYVKGSLPLVGNDVPAMEAFTRLVLTVDHIVGTAPAGLPEARGQVVHVLRSSMDVERLRRLVAGSPAAPAAGGAGAAAGAGVLASMGALVAPLQMFRRARSLSRFVPAPLKTTLAAVVVAAILSIPLLTGYSAGRAAERSARRREAEARPSGSSTAHAQSATS